MKLNLNESCNVYNCIDIVFRISDLTEEQTLIEMSFKPEKSTPIYEGALQMRVDQAQIEAQWSLRLYVEKGTVERVETIAYMTRQDMSKIKIEIKFELLNN